MAEKPPYRIPDDTSVDDRLRLLEGLSSTAARTAEFRRLAMRVNASVPWNASDREAKLAAAALTEIQKLPFRPDPPGEWFQEGTYTLDHGGDCEDLAVAVVTLARLLGLDAQIIWITQPGHDLNHVSAAMVLRGAWEWTDPSLRGARVGESPYDALKRLQPTGQHTARTDIAMGA